MYIYIYIWVHIATYNYLATYLATHTYLYSGCMKISLSLPLPCCCPFVAARCVRLIAGLIEMERKAWRGTLGSSRAALF